ncbi:hypothetical protein ABR776_27225 [Bacillus cereus]|uniref:Zinc-finger domain-containing protein n=2 Tax=Bacillus cereus TaxID=1396 RepID=A0A1C4DT94_BACCE|nr:MULTISPECIES: hypothetical protein [Bacillus cereus group]HDR7784938.1 hypothetical protein [Bacillus wiedmannii]MCU5435799.1 hypothetical protein [Bacillus mobilis]OKA27345.1 hypothetical protein BJR06_29995 [Bacillus cereus]OKA29191.1 hypothetical protein BJR06_29680 [Bacillus cereus]OKA30503.1 hypothetical protein BJR07_30000 [Bacillus cereus]
MNAKDARIKILNTQDKHCKNCEYRYQQLDHCYSNCAIGKELVKLGLFLGGKEAVQNRKRKTKEEWDSICVKAAAMREDGMTYAAIARYFGIADGKNVSGQMKKRGLA